MIHKNQINDENSLWKISKMKIYDLGKNIVTPSPQGGDALRESIYF